MNTLFPYEICIEEELKVTDLEISSNPEFYMIRSGSKKYIWFPNWETAKRIVKHFVRSKLDGDEKKYLEDLNISIDEFLESSIENNGIESLISFDTKHVIELEDGSLCYRLW